MLRKRNNTTAFNVRMDVRDFAAIVSAYRNHVAPSTSMSSYLRYAAEDYVRHLQKTGKAKVFETTEAANDYIIDAGLRQQAKAVRAAHDLVLELAANKADIEIEDRKTKKGPEPPTPDEIIAMLERDAADGHDEGTT